MSNASPGCTPLSAKIRIVGLRVVETQAKVLLPTPKQLKVAKPDLNEIGSFECEPFCLAEFRNELNRQEYVGEESCQGTAGLTLGN